MAAYGRNIEGHNIEDKIHCTAPKLAETWLKSSLAICHYVKVQQPQAAQSYPVLLIYYVISLYK